MKILRTELYRRDHGRKQAGTPLFQQIPKSFSRELEKMIFNGWIWRNWDITAENGKIRANTALKTEPILNDSY